jgi:hypothetical protein
MADVAAIRAREGVCTHGVRVIGRNDHAARVTTLLATSAARVHSASEVQSAPAQPFLRAFARTAGPDEASRVVPIVTCDRCGNAKVLGSACFACARLINVNARGLPHSENEVGSVPTTGTAAVTACEQIPPSRPRRDRLRLNAGVA